MIYPVLASSVSPILNIRSEESLCVAARWVVDGKTKASHRLWYLIYHEACCGAMGKSHDL
jgi:hypothetical protein